MASCGMRATIPERLLAALDDRLEAMLCGAPGIAEGQRPHPEPGLELAPLLAVAGELIRSREWIDERLALERTG